MAAMAETLRNILIFLTLFFIPTHQLHLLDPLTPSELDQVRTIVTTSEPNSSFHYVGLDEPDKPTVLSWLVGSPTPSPPPPRRAFVVTRVNRTTHEIVIDLSKNSVVSDKVHEGHGFPLLTFDEQTTASDLVRKYLPFVAALGKRGLRIEEVACGAFTVGWYGWRRKSGDTTKRVVRVMCYSFEGTVNAYMRPIEGLTTTVDLDLMEVVGFRDRLVVSVPKADGTDYRESEQKPPFAPRLKGMAMVQPDSPNFAIDGHLIRYETILMCRDYLYCYQVFN